MKTKQKRATDPPKPYAVNRTKIAAGDVHALMRLNADVIMAANQQRLGECAMTREELAGAAMLRQHLKLQISLDRERRDQFEVAEMRDLVSELRELKDWILKNGSSDGSVGASTATH